MGRAGTVRHERCGAIEGEAMEMSGEVGWTEGAILVGYCSFRIRRGRVSM